MLYIHGMMCSVMHMNEQKKWNFVVAPCSASCKTERIHQNGNEIQL